MLKEAEKIKNCSFNLFSHSLLHTDKQVLTSHVSKILKANDFDLVIQLYQTDRNPLGCVFIAFYSECYQNIVIYRRSKIELKRK